MHSTKLLRPVFARVPSLLNPNANISRATPALSCTTTTTTARHLSNSATRADQDQDQSSAAKVRFLPTAVGKEPMVTSRQLKRYRPHIARLKWKTCMVTGGSSGIGLETARAFLTEGAARVYIIGRNKDKLAEALDDLKPANIDDRVTTIVGDVSDPAFWDKEMERIMVPLDVLVNAAGTSHTSLLALTSPERISEVLNSNLQSTILACRALMKQTLRRGSAGIRSARPRCIINISSLHAQKSGVGAAAYASAKAGVIGLTRALVAEGAAMDRDRQGSHIRANVIVPGYIDTKMLDGLSHKVLQEARDSTPLRRIGQPAEVADAAVFLAANGFANNCVLNIDGGLSAL